MKLIATFFYVGLLRPGPGTWGSLTALPVAYGILTLGGFWLLLAATLALYPLGWAATRAETAGKADHDPGHIVVDEVVGQWIALFPVAYGAMFMSADLWRLWPGWVSAFVFFRLFDIWKPWLVGRADRMGGPTGVMLDDVIAGVFSAIVTIILAAISHGVLM
ncbi:phosphatidylglycerophosphatase A family protein [Salipiger mucosus]|uniref:Phosphatidylglycerophosphatase A n=1 Tax=Salipiger mucosus DSM 16094 TaxID=1123237 RepID=S9Q7S4_9RHOB|nr:phosphatidylglycerophosphatase A [Salipiger mucosus]EPX76057.1 Phosphatidylglycerophosphatase A [Salipiger mucosus DSM 16094]